ncbi:MAG: helix-turn-helix domain-containing protein [Smithella sp.]
MTLYRTKEAASYLTTKPVTLELWRTIGSGPEFIKLGKAVRYSKEALDSFIESKKRTNTSQTGLPAR